MKTVKVRMTIKDINTSSADGFVIMRRREVDSVIDHVLPGIELRKQEHIEPYNLGQTNTPIFYNRISSSSMAYALPSCHSIPLVKQFIDRLVKNCKAGGALACTSTQECYDEDSVHELHATEHHQSGRSVGCSGPMET
ncbi:MAG: hypothetical protein PHC50_08720 [Candidatus Cloacimonetes bacterium]|nr:hypothetical protein [Candidatus Cloacimonadota bacterium]